MNEKTKKVSALNLILIIQLIFMLGLSIGITQLISQKTKTSSINYMSTIAEERSQIIKTYVENAEKTLSQYSHAGEILSVIKNPDDKDIVNAAQKYTEEFSKDIVNLEGIYVSEWNTHVLAHTNKQTAGMTTRTGDPLKALQDSLIAAGDGVYDTGIIISPASGKQIVSMYKAVYDENKKPVGLVGLGVYTEGLVDTLDALGKRDMESSFYSMVNVKDNKYIFNEDPNKVSAEATNNELLKTCAGLRSMGVSKTGSFEYKANGENYISIYSYMADEGWLFMIDDTEKEIFALTNNMKLYLVVFCIFCLVLIVIFNIISKKQEKTAMALTSAVAKNAKTKESLNTAIFNDILTDCRSRVSFSNDFEPGKVTETGDAPYYFIMLNIDNFSNVNIMYGEEVGDMVLLTTADTLRSNFDGGMVYRTGSDEFVVSIQMANGAAGYSNIMSRVDSALRILSEPFATENGNVIVSYRVAAVRKSKDVDSSVISTLKNIINQSDIAVQGQTTFIDMDLLDKN